MKQSVPTSPLRFDFPQPRPRSFRSRLVARWFGLNGDDAKSDARPSPIDPARLASMLPLSGQILLISGPSGAGKSSLVRALCGAMSETWIDLDAQPLPDRPLVDCFERVSIQRTLKLLGRVGLAEAWTYLRTPAQLSAGQRWRLRLALAISQTRGPTTLVGDEFAALLDRVTAAVVARALRRAVSAHPSLGAIVATSHDDLFEALQPDLHVRCDFGSVGESSK